MIRRDSFVVATSGDDTRLDAAVARRLPDISRAAVRKMIEAGLVTVNDTYAKPSRKVKSGDRIDVTIQPAAALTAEPEDISLDIVYQDEDLAVIDKPAGLVVHPAPGHERGTLSNALMARFPHLQNDAMGQRPGIVHRLDKNTSGLIVVALNSTAHRSLQKQIGERSLDRRYLALVSGELEPATATIRAPIGRDFKERSRMAVYGAASRAAETSYATLDRFRGFTLLEAKLHTGRTHQIRVHLASVGHPVAGDETYGGAPVPGLDRQFLHAYRLTLTSPSTDQTMTFTSSLPTQLESVLSMLRKVSASSEHNDA